MLFDGVLVLATFLCSLVGGFLFAFAVVVMPGIKSLDDAGFLRAFQVMDGVIRKNQPLFLLAWVGSVLAVIAAAGLGVFALTGGDRVLLVAAALVYVLCVQVPTFAVNIPLNDHVQRLDIATADEALRRRAREDFEPKWNRWNVFRSACASLVTIALAVLLLRV
jgi:uncharacterized membrane protein